MKDRSYYNLIRRLAVFAFVFTLLLGILYAVFSLQNTATMKAGVEWVKEVIRPIFSEEKALPKSFSGINTAKNGSMLYCGEDSYMQSYLFPSNADQTVTYTTDNPYCTIADDGKITWNRLDRTQITVTATSKSNPALSTTMILYASGINPDDERIEYIETRLYDSEYGSTQSDVAALYTTQLYYLRPFAKIKAEHLEELGLSADNPYTEVCSLSNVTSSAGEIRFQQERRKFTFINEGETALGVSFCDGNFQPFTRQAEPRTFRVNADPAHNYTPTNPLTFTANGEVECSKEGDGVYRVTAKADCTFFNLYCDDVAGVNTISKLVVDEQYNDLVYHSGNYFYRYKNSGNMVVKLVSLLDESIETVIYVDFVKPSPEKLSVYPQKGISIFDDKMAYGFEFDRAVREKGNLTAEVIEGKDVLTVSKDGKEIKVRKTGTVTVRYTSTEFPTLYTDVSLRVSFLGGDLSNFIAKIIGHFLTFFLLGMGISVCYFLLTKPKKLTPLYAISTTFLYSALTELFQSPLFHNDRGAKWIDVFFNTASGIMGMAVAFAIIGVCVAIVKRKKEKYDRLLEDFSKLRFKTMWRK